MNLELLDFTRRALEQGLPRERISGALHDAGWSPADVNAALAAFAETDFPLPVPRPRPYLSAQEVFVYALMFTALYASAWNLGALVFRFIDLAVPDPARRVFHAVLMDGVRRNIAALVVAFPLFAFLLRHVHAAIDRDPTKRESRPRKWLTWLTLFIAAAALIGDVSALVYNVLGGELGARFLLKVATVAVIAGGTFGYFLADIRKDEAA
ncbi:DUF5671 domain-containing protein [Phenylobacterium soli]|uniref:DUF5671 domain-containing protein n=1 Tax=Phenylobacterium soli TaxID=2170551 RepID=A0A328AG21_9CAUL|nr:DUF5671 domain-containing protein [Phenylobacterium soli]RAK53702.1 hypothetical protein DJ017_03750 [Phenylobacterium soli]